MQIPDVNDIVFKIDWNGMLYGEDRKESPAGSVYNALRITFLHYSGNCHAFLRFKVKRQSKRP
jgi:hypothetical protein